MMVDKPPLELPGGVQVWNWCVGVERDVAEVTPARPEPDPDWVYVDHAGHKHRWLKNGGVLGARGEDYVAGVCCEVCSEPIMGTRILCRHCGEDLDDEMRRHAYKPPDLCRRHVSGPARARGWIEFGPRLPRQVRALGGGFRLERFCVRAGQAVAGRGVVTEIVGTIVARGASYLRRTVYFQVDGRLTTRPAKS